MVEEGLKIDKESVFNSSEYETWKRKWLFLTENEIDESFKMTQNWLLQKMTIFEVKIKREVNVNLILID